jgi:hypothetical protein
MKISFYDLINLYPFYKKARDLWLETQVNQILKGLQKYHEPLTPKKHTAKQLLTHAMEESVDLTHYLIALDELIEEKDQLISQQAVMIADLEERIKYLEQVKFDYVAIKPPYMDLDDL